MAASSAWTEERAKWVAAERPAIEARQLFERIYALWTTMQREGDRVELVLGDGMLDVPDHHIRHPVLLQRVNLEFDPSVPSFRFDPGTEKADLHRALLRLVPGIKKGQMVAQFVEELEEQPLGPLGDVDTDGFFRRLVQGLFNDGEFREARPRGQRAGRVSGGSR